MISIKSLLLSVLFLLFTGCSDKKEKEAVSTEQIKACTVPKEQNISEQNCSENNNSNLTGISSMSENSTILKSIKDETHGVTVEKNRFIINDVKQPVVLVNFFSTWCPPCRGQIPYFEDLQKKYKKELFITGILVNDDANATKLEQFYSKYPMDYFVSSGMGNNYVTKKVIEALKLDANFTLPLTVLYKNSNYYTHYEGPVPVEMIDHDIKTAIEEK